MVRTALLAVGALGWLLLANAPAHGDLISWSYEWSNTPGSVKSNSGKSEVKLHTGGWRPAAGSSDLIAASLRTLSNAAATLPDRFTLRPYSLTMTIKDAESGLKGSVTFTGALSGTLSRGAANLRNLWTSPTTEELHLGQHVYLVSVTSFTAPGPPSSSSPGSIAAHVTVSHNPEPNGLLLGALAIPGLWWLRRRKLT